MVELLSLSLGKSSVERLRNEHFDTSKLRARSTEGEGEGEGDFDRRRSYVVIESTTPCHDDLMGGVLLGIEPAPPHCSGCKVRHHTLQHLQ